MKTVEEKSREFYNQIANGYDNTFEGKFTEEFKELLLGEIRLNPNSSVLDVACGNGTLLKMLAEKFDIRGCGVDISEKMIENARAKCPSMKFAVSRCDNMPFEEEMFEAITVCAAYHHFSDTTAFAKEACRLLKPRGMLYVAEPYYPFIIRAICNPFVPLMKAGDVKFYSPRDIKANFETLGFKQMRFKKQGHIQVFAMQKL